MDHTNCHVDMIDKPFEGEVPEGATQAQLAVSGMGCPNCAARVHNALLQLEGVLKAEVLLESGTALVLYNSQKVEPHALMQAVELMGIQSNHNYQAQLIS
jgi:Cd2+/Zn2+-exporting ATPase/Cu+-exporting ATPase